MAIAREEIIVPPVEGPISEALMLAAEQIGIKLEYVGGIPVWEAMPNVKHQRAVDRVRASLRRRPGTDLGCSCIHYNDILIRFPDGSQKRPDIVVFCQEPEEEESEVTLIPEAVIEIISKGYEKKDLEIGVPFYLAQGIKDIVTFDYRTGEVIHFRREAERRLQSPVEIALECGCVCTV